MKTWHYATSANEQFQVSEAEIPGLIANGTISPQTRVWSSGMANWAAAHEMMPALFGGDPASSGPPAMNPLRPLAFGGMGAEGMKKEIPSNFTAMQETTAAVHYAIDISPEELEATRLTEEHFRTAALLLHTQGFVILKQALPTSLVDEARNEFGRIFQDCVSSQQGDAWYQVAKQTEAVFWERNNRWRIFPKLRAPFDSSQILSNPFAGGLLSSFLGNDYYCKFVSSDTCLKGAKVQSPHRELGAGWSWQPRTLVVNIPLAHSGLENGPLEIWTGGSHLWSNAVLEKFEWKDDVQDGSNPWLEWFATLFPSRRVVLEPGDMLIRDPGLMHRGTVNDTDEPRTMLTLCYFRHGESHDYGRIEFNLDRPLWENLAPEARGLFAHEFESASAKPAPN